MKIAKIIAPFGLSAILFILAYLSSRESNSGFFPIMLFGVGIILAIAGISLKNARHSHASLMLRQGVHPKVVQERLGHSSIKITLDTYSKVASGIQEAAALGFDKAVLPQLENKVIGNN